MRIALITREYPPETSWGGIGTFYHSFARSLKGAGCGVEVFTQGLHRASSDDLDGILVHRVVPRAWLIGGRFGGSTGGTRSIGLFALSLAIEMQRAFSRRHALAPFDLVEGHEHLGINALINYAHGASLATVTRYHTSYHTLVSRGFANWPRSSIIRYLEQYSLRSAHYRICASDFIDTVTQEDFPGIPRADAVIPFSIEPAGAGDPAPEKERLIVFIGRMMPGVKNPDMVAAAFAALAGAFPAWRVEFAGVDIPIDRTETMWQRCESILLPWKGRYAYHGVLSREQVNALYRRARIMVIPSKFESFGLVAQEGMAAGCVPVVADHTALSEVVGQEGVVFRNGSQEDLNAKLGLLLSDEASLKERSDSCIRHVKEQYSEELVTRKNLDLFERAARSIVKKHQLGTT